MSSYYDRVKQVVENIENNIENDLDIKSLAKEYSLSPWHFQRLFKGIVGDSLGGYMRGRRLTRGAELLLESELDIIDIAVEVGFGSHEAFTRSFKKQFSQTPKEFRKLSPKVIPNRKPYLNKELQDYIFNGIESHNPKGRKVRQLIRTRLGKWDDVPPHPDFQAFEFAGTLPQIKSSQPY